MLEYLKNEANMTQTENGAATYLSTGSDCLDLFATVGALRRENEEKIENAFVRAFAENPDLAMKILFFARDVRGGLGERRVFRVALRRFSFFKPESVKKNLPYVAEFGRFDDLLTLIGTSCENEALDLIKEQFGRDRDAMEKDKPVSLLAKWLPSVNASNAETKKLGKKIAKALGLSEAEYRKTFAALRKKIRIIENNLRERDYTFDYSAQPSRALFKYKSAFYRNDGERYREFLKKAASGEAVLHADNVSPYELVEPYLEKNWFSGMKSFARSASPGEQETLNATWAALPDFGGDGNALAVIDTSGSMYWAASPVPASVALSLGLYFAERNKGAFGNHFIEFSADPQLIELKGETFFDRLTYAASFNQVANTDLEAVFDLVLNAALKNGVPQEELPAKLVIVSDMEFDQCVDNANELNFANAKKKYEAHGYRLPQIVFWNVAARHRNQPVSLNEQGVALVSGVTPRLFGMVAGELESPYAFMLEVLGSERYERISA
ncbi:MAG: DUF2828 family protein [Clostridia bacterium]|nr:DUF2828 family protein [Clostridia bacterium]